MYCVRVSPGTVEIFLAQHYKEKEVVGNLCISLDLCCGSGMFMPDPGYASKNIGILTPKNGF
jgi:hypothetical protein